MSDKRLREFLERNEDVNLGNLFEYLQGIAEGLEGEIRWAAREKIAGQSVRENDLQHTFKQTFLTTTCAVVENEWRRVCGLLPFGKVQLDVGQLAIMALVHDMGEIIRHDMPHFEKVKLGAEPQMAELTAFEHIVAPLPKEACEYFIQAYKRTMFRSGELENDREAKFFNATENLSHLKRGLHECRQGNLHFAPKCLDWHIKVLDGYSHTDFPTLKMWYGPYIGEAEEYLEKFKAEREKYLAEFVKRDRKEEDFPF